MYAGLLTGKLDQREAFFEVHSTVGRDVRLDPASVATLASRVTAWQAAVDAALAAVEKPLAATMREAEESVRADAALKRAMEDGKAALEKESKDGGRHDGGGGDAMATLGACARAVKRRLLRSVVQHASMVPCRFAWLCAGAMLGSVMGAYGDDT